jgi:Cytochrome B561
MSDLRPHAPRVLFHWILAAFVIAMLIVGFLVLRPMPNTDPAKIAILGFHMAGGTAILLLLVARLSIRFPAGGLPGRRRSARILHGSLYGLVVLLLGTGAATAVITGLPRMVFGRDGHLPERFTVFPTFLAHAVLAELLTVLIVVHIGAALYHQFVLKDGLLSDMASPRRRSETASAD